MGSRRPRCMRGTGRASGAGCGGRVFVPFYSLLRGCRLSATGRQGHGRGMVFHSLSFPFVGVTSGGRWSCATLCNTFRGVLHSATPRKWRVPFPSLSFLFLPFSGVPASGGCRERARPVQHCATLSSMCCTTRPGGGGGFPFLPFCSFPRCPQRLAAPRRKAERYRAIFTFPTAAAPGGAICKWGLFSYYTTALTGEAVGPGSPLRSARGSGGQLCSGGAAGARGHSTPPARGCSAT